MTTSEPSPSRLDSPAASAARPRPPARAGMVAELALALAADDLVPEADTPRVAALAVGLLQVAADGAAAELAQLRAERDAAVLERDRARDERNAVSRDRVGLRTKADRLARDLDDARATLALRDGELVSANAQRDAARARVNAAADRLDALIAEATPGPWRTHDTHLNAGGHTATVLSGEGNATDLRAWLPTWSHEPWDESRNCWNDAAYIAAMNPDVGRALAALLRQLVQARSRCGDIRSALGERGVEIVIPGYRAALDLARAILGTREET